MLELRPICERCDATLARDTDDARICTFECTFCASCADELGGVCPNCGGNLVQRPARPTALLEMSPDRTRAAPVMGVRDVEAAVAWFTSVLGFVCDPDRDVFGPPGEPAVYATLSLGSAPLHLQIRRREVFAERRESHEGDAYMFVADADALFAQHVAAGAEVHRAIEDSDYGLRDYTVVTPDGHRLTFGSPVT